MFVKVLPFWAHCMFSSFCIFVIELELQVLQKIYKSYLQKETTTVS